MTYRHNWGEDRVYFHDDDGRLVSVPAQWTNVLASDPFVALSRGRSAFRVQDLFELVGLIGDIRKGGRKDGRGKGHVGCQGDYAQIVKRNMPKRISRRKGKGGTVG